MPAPPLLLPLTSAQRLPKAAQRGPRPPLVPVQVLVQPPTHSYQRSESGEQLICYTMQRQPDGGARTGWA